MTPMSSPSQIRRKSQALGSVKTMTLQDLKCSMNDSIVSQRSPNKPVRVLVTVHSIKPLLGDVYTRGLGLWVGYIVQKYLKMRQIAHRLYMKSILTSDNAVFPTTPKTVLKFLKRNKIDYWIPSDVTDTMFAAQYHDLFRNEISSLKFAVTPNLSIYQRLENKWETFQMMSEFGIPTPETKLFDSDNVEFPFFLKVASGTNGGRGVWHCTCEQDLKDALKAKETKGPYTLLLAQRPTYGEVICAEIIYCHGKPVGFFFAKSVQADDLAGQGSKYVNSQSEHYKQIHSHEKVVLEDAQWEAVTKIFLQIGQATNYHGMIDIEFIVAGPNNNSGNANAPQEGSVWLLECNPRFSGDIHTTLSNPGFLDLYFDVLNDNVSNMVCGNYSVGVDLKSKFGSFFPTNFYVQHPLKVLSLRHWNVNNYHSYDPVKDPLYLDHVHEGGLKHSLTTSFGCSESTNKVENDSFELLETDDEEGRMVQMDYPHFEHEDSITTSSNSTSEG